ncbi:MAG: phosphotransferase, partial [Anaerolineales bacterium]|nr:phosphotransferase [Anaerolineales bacterium]
SEADLDPAPLRAALAAAAPRRPNPPTLLHGDFWPGNVLWHNGRLAAIIDWEDAARGDPLIDLARSRSEIAWILGPAALDAFTRHYLALAAIHTADLPYWDLCAALRFLRLANGDLAGLAAYFAAYGRADITAATIRRHVHAFIAAARARLPAG